MRPITLLLLIAILPLVHVAQSTPGPDTGTPSATPTAQAEPLAIEDFPAGDEPRIVPVADLGDSIQMTPGESRSLAVGVYDCCYFFEPLDASTAWSVTEVEGVSIDPDTGLLTIDQDVPNDTSFTVTAEVEDVTEDVTAEVHVYTAESQPLVGIWREEVQVACATGEEIVPMEPIRELRFDADGTFSVTWTPFEIYQDYWGTFTVDPDTGSLTLEITGANVDPVNFDGTGTFEVTDNGSLVLNDLSLGTQSLVAHSICGHRFAD